MPELRALHGTAQQRRLRQPVHRARPQIHHRQGVSPVHDRHELRGQRGNQRRRQLQHRSAHDGHRAQRRGGQRLPHAQAHQLGQRNALARNAHVESDEARAVGEEEAAEVGGEGGAADGGGAEPAVGEGEVGREGEELVGRVQRERPADRQVLRVESHDLDLARRALVVLGVREREKEKDETAVDAGFVGEEELAVEEGNGVADGVGDRVEDAEIPVRTDEQIAAVQRQHAVRLQIAEMAGDEGAGRGETWNRRC